MDTLLLAPSAAGSAGDGAVGAARDVLAGDGAVEVVRPSSREQLDAALDHRDGRRLVLAGGDGSLHVLVQRLWRRHELSDVPVGIVPWAPATTSPAICGCHWTRTRRQER